MPGTQVESRAIRIIPPGASQSPSAPSACLSGNMLSILAAGKRPSRPPSAGCPRDRFHFPHTDMTFHDDAGECLPILVPRSSFLVPLVPPKEQAHRSDVKPAFHTCSTTLPRCTCLGCVDEDNVISAAVGHP